MELKEPVASHARPRRRATFGVVTLGQAPRADVLPDMSEAVGEHIALLEAGALDDATTDEIEALAPDESERALVTRLRDGRGVTVSKARLSPRLAAAVERAAADSDAVIVLCSGEFDEFPVDVPVIYPDRVLRGLVSGLIGSEATLGVISPLRRQAASAPARWGSVAGSVAAVAASPYQDASALSAAADSLRSRRPDLVVLDCMGFARRHRDLVLEAVRCPVLLPCTCVAAVARQALAQ